MEGISKELIPTAPRGGDPQQRSESREEVDSSASLLGTSAQGASDSITLLRQRLTSSPKEAYTTDDVPGYIQAFVEKAPNYPQLKSIWNNLWRGLGGTSKQSASASEASGEGMSVSDLLRTMKEKILKADRSDEFSVIATEFINKSDGKPELAQNREAAQGYIQWSRVGKYTDSSMNLSIDQHRYVLLKNALGRAIVEGKNPIVSVSPDTEIRYF